MIVCIYSSMQHPLDRFITMDQSTISVVDNDVVLARMRVTTAGTNDPCMHIHIQFCGCYRLLMYDDGIIRLWGN